MASVTVPVTLAVGVAEGGEGSGVRVLLAALLGYLLLGTSVVLVLAATSRALTEIDAEHAVGVRRAYQLALARWRPLVGAFLAASTVLAVLSLTVVLAPVAVVLAVLWSLFVPVAALEGDSALGALRRSAQLVRRHVVKVAILLVISTLFTSLVGALLGTLLILVTSAPLWSANVVAGVTYAILMPYVGLVMTYLYFDTRVTALLVRTAAPPEEVLPAELL